MYTLVPTILLLWSLAQVHTLTSNDEKKVREICPAEACGKNKNDRFRSCHCDAACLSYNDCCVDSPFLQTRYWPSDRIDQKVKLICLTIGRNKYKGVYLLSSCNVEEGNNTKLNHRCKRSNLNRDLYRPVFDKTDHTAYSNHFCAQCNQVPLKRLSWFKQKILCHGKKLTANSTFIPRMKCGRNKRPSKSHLKKKSRIFWKRKFAKCQTIYNIPNEIEKTLRHCNPRGISHCESDWKDKNTKRKCKIYQAEVYTNGTVYRNPHCVICNRKQTEDLSCFKRSFH